MTSPTNKRSNPLAVAARPSSRTKNNRTPRASPGTFNGASSYTPPSSDNPRTKKIAKAVRGGGKGVKTKARTVGDGPEAELSGSEDEISDVENEQIIHDAVDRVVEGSEGKSVPKSEIDMTSLISGAKPRQEPHKLSRGYEMITSPASRMVLPLDNRNPQAPHLARHDSVMSSSGFTDDSEWENVQFEMDGDIPVGKRDAYADVVKRVGSMAIV